MKKDKMFVYRIEYTVSNGNQEEHFMCRIVAKSIYDALNYLHSNINGKIRIISYEIETEVDTISKSIKAGKSRKEYEKEIFNLKIRNSQLELELRKM